MRPPLLCDSHVLPDHADPRHTIWYTDTSDFSICVNFHELRTAVWDPLGRFRADHVSTLIVDRVSRKCRPTSARQLDTAADSHAQ